MQKGGDADGKQPRGESPAIRGVLRHRFGGCHGIRPKSVLAAGGNQRLAFYEPLKKVTAYSQGLL